MATNKYPKGKGYTPNRPFSRTEPQAKKLGLPENRSQAGTTMGIFIDKGGYSREEFQRKLNRGRFANNSKLQGPTQPDQPGRPKVRKQPILIGKPTVAKPKKK